MFYMQITRGDGGGGGWGEREGKRVLLGTHPKLLGAMNLIMPRLGEKKRGYGEGVKMVNVPKLSRVGKETPEKEVYAILD